MKRAVLMLLICAVLHVAPPIVYLTLWASDPDAAHDLFTVAVAWTVALVAYDVLRMRGLRRAD